MFVPYTSFDALAVAVALAVEVILTPLDLFNVLAALLLATSLVAP